MQIKTTDRWHVTLTGWIESKQWTPASSGEDAVRLLSVPQIV